MARANQAQVYSGTIWGAAWSWKDSPEPCEQVFAPSQEECATLLDQQVAAGRTVLKRLGVVTNSSQANEYMKIHEPKKIDLFDPKMRDFAQDILTQMKETGKKLLVWRGDRYTKMFDAAHS